MHIPIPMDMFGYRMFRSVQKTEKMFVNFYGFLIPYLFIQVDIKKPANTSNASLFVPGGGCGCENQEIGHICVNQTKSLPITPKFHPI